MAKTGRPNFAYILQGTWRGASHKFQITGNTTGSALGAGDAQDFMEGSLSPFALSFAPFMATEATEVIGTRYYNGTSSAPVFEADYDPGAPPAALVPTCTGFSATDADGLPLEVCVMLEARVGTSSKGKPVFCRKYLRGAPRNGIAEGGGWSFSSTAAASASTMGDGSWYNSITYASPKGATADSNGWSALVEPGNHQIPRGKKRKTSSSSGSQSSLLNSLLTAIAGGATGTALEKIIAAAGEGL